MDDQQDTQMGNIIYVDPNSEIGTMMTNMNKMEEKSIVDSCKSELELKKITNQQAINGLQNFMRMWDLPDGRSSRTFYYIPNYLKELKGNQNESDQNCVIT